MRWLTRWSSHADCSLATLALLARVDLEQLLAGTRHAHRLPPSSAASTRQQLFEEHIRAEGHAPTLSLLREVIGLRGDNPRIVSLRNTPSATSQTRSLHADRTLMVLHHVVNGHPNAPSLADGGVLRVDLRGVPAKVVSDALLANVEGRLHVVEISTPETTDSVASRQVRSTALERAATYITLLREAVQRLDGAPTAVSSDAVIISPGDGGRPHASKVDVTRRLARFRAVREAMPSVDDRLAHLPARLSFTPVADLRAYEGKRIEALRQMADEVGIAYTPACVSTCGNALFCRTLAHSPSGAQKPRACTATSG